MAAAPIKDSSISLLLIERDSSGDDLCVWSYPGAPMSVQNVCVQRVSAEGQCAPFIYFKLKQDWIYVQSLAINNKDILPDVVSASVCVVSKHFNPDVYSNLAKILMEQYRVSGDPTKILEGQIR
jgi:hypothetical protein